MNKFWSFVKERTTIEAVARQMEEAFPFISDGKRHVISVVGAGGKTSLLYAMAEVYCQRGANVLMMTSTHMQKPDGAFFAKLPEEVDSLWKKGQFAVLGVETEDNKLTKLPDIALWLDNHLVKKDAGFETWMHILKQADTILIEADGARRLPCKAPAEHEPVIWQQTDIVIDVAGLSALGKKVSECCCRPEQVMDILQASGEHRLRPCDVAALVTSAKGGRKQVLERTYYILLNQCDTIAELEQAGRIVSCLPEKMLKNCIASCLQTGKMIN